jgi:hypothetical protein
MKKKMDGSRGWTFDVEEFVCGKWSGKGFEGDRAWKILEARR